MARRVVVVENNTSLTLTKLTADAIHFRVNGDQRKEASYQSFQSGPVRNTDPTFCFNSICIL